MAPSSPSPPNATVLSSPGPAAAAAAVLTRAGGGDDDDTELKDLKDLKEKGESIVARIFGRNKRARSVDAEAEAAEAEAIEALPKFLKVLNSKDPHLVGVALSIVKNCLLLSQQQIITAETLANMVKIIREKPAEYTSGQDFSRDADNCEKAFDILAASKVPDVKTAVYNLLGEDVTRLDMLDDTYDEDERIRLLKRTVSHLNKKITRMSLALAKAAELAKDCPDAVDFIETELVSI